MKFCKILFIAALTVVISSCGASKQIPYFQDLSNGSEVSPTIPTEIKIQPKDKLSIIVNCQDQRLTNMFNLPVVSQQIGTETTSSSSSGSSRGLLGYTVASDGSIDFPIVGKLYVEGMTREQLGAYIKKELQNRDLIKDPVVTVEFMNYNVAVLGEVSSPGRYSIDKDNYTILDVLSTAGDLTVYGKRENVRVIRTEDGVQHAYSIDLTSAQSIYTSPAYYLKQNDVVYVEPNDTKARQSTVNGNTVLSTSFWLSLASFLTTLAVIIF